MARAPGFEFLEHMADIKFVARGATPAAVFENAARALSAYVAEGRNVSQRAVTQIEVEGRDYESLMYAFLDELLYLLDAEHFVTARAAVKVEGTKLKAAVYGDDAARYVLKHVKAATYAEMYVKETLRGWEAQVVLDV